jgi:hypothetical protein
MNRRKRKQYFKKHKDLLNQVVAIVDDVDPMGIIFSARVAGFVIESEYLPEAEAIVWRLERWNSMRSLEAGLKHVFDYFFYYPEVAPEYYQLTARRIWNAWLLSLGNPPLDFPDDIHPPEHKPPVLIEIG